MLVEVLVERREGGRPHGKTAFLIGKVRQSSCFCAHVCSVLTAGEVLAWKERGKERKAGV